MRACGRCDHCSVTTSPDDSVTVPSSPLTSIATTRPVIRVPFKPQSEDGQSPVVTLGASLVDEVGSHIPAPGLLMNETSHRMNPVIGTTIGSPCSCLRNWAE